MVLPTPRQVLGNAIVAAHLPGQRRLPYADPEDVARLRERRVRRIVRYAARHVPFYRDWFADARVDPRDVRRAGDLRALPIVTKEELRAAPERFASRAARARRPVAFVTSGTTGERTTVLHDRLSLLANIAWGERERAALDGALGGRAIERELAVVHGASTVLQVWTLYARSTWAPARPPRTVLPIELPLADVVARIEAERPTLLMAYGSYLDLLLRWVATRGGLRHRPAAVLYGADALSADGRRFLTRDLGVRVLSTYSAAEAFKIGFTCEAAERFHVHADLCHLRLVDERCEDVPLGKPGEVVLSNLVNHATVLLNYRLGDVASLSGERCACGRTLPAITALAGRSEDAVELPGGAVLHPRSVWGLVKHHPEVMRFQLVQREPDRLELRLMTPDRAAYERAAPPIVAALRALAPHARSDASFAPDLGVAEPGKFRTVVALQRGAGRAAERT